MQRRTVLRFAIYGEPGERLEDIAKLPNPKQTELFNVMDAYLRDYRTGKTYVK